MEIRWTAVLIGYCVDFVLSILVQGFAPPDYGLTIDLNQQSHLIILSLQVLATGVGGYVAGRMAPGARHMHGLLVGVIGVLLNYLPATLAGVRLPTEITWASLIACGVALLGGLLGSYPAQPPTLK